MKKMGKSGAFVRILLLALFAGCASTGKNTKSVPEDSTLGKTGIEQAEKRIAKPRPRSTPEATSVANDPNRAFFCELQVLITKFEAYGTTMEDARTRVRNACREKFENLHCIDDEDLHCRKTFY